MIYHSVYKTEQTRCSVLQFSDWMMSTDSCVYSSIIELCLSLALITVVSVLCCGSMVLVGAAAAEYHL